MHVDVARPANLDQTVILVAEDEAIVRNVAQLALTRDGHFVLSARNGVEALDISREYPGPIHILVSDIRMPVIDGLKLREIIIAERPTIKVLLMSGEVEKPSGAIPFLKKPFGPTALKQEVRLLLSS